MDNSVLNRRCSVGSVSFSPALVLAPMSGVTTSAFRRLIKELNPGSVGLVVTEFISVEALTRKVIRSLFMLKFRPEERPISIQIFGYDIKRMRDAALMAADAGADIVDINCGCPAPKVVRKGGGCELMRQPLHLSKILGEVRQVLTSTPLTLKFRSGWDESSKNAREIAQIAESEGVDALAMHGRTRAQLYRGYSNKEHIWEICSSVKIPVFASGDVVNAAGAIELCAGGAAGVFIGRGAMRNPLIFSEIMGDVTSIDEPVDIRKARIVVRYSELLREDFSERNCVGKMKQLASQMGSGTRWRKEILKLSTFSEQCDLLKSVVLGSWCPTAGEVKKPQVEGSLVDICDKAEGV